MCVPSACSSSGSTVLTVAFVPTGMNAGVGSSPCAVRRIPARAAPSLAVLRLHHVALAAVDRGGELVAGKRQGPLTEPEVVHPDGRLVEQPGDGQGVFLLSAADVHNTSIASPNE